MTPDLVPAIGTASRRVALAQDDSESDLRVESAIVHAAVTGDGIDAAIGAPAMLHHDAASWSRETCPLCRTPGPLLSDPRNPRWRCRICTRSWTPERLEAVSAYAAFCAARGE
jgi:hypothetical protein